MVVTCDMHNLNIIFAHITALHTSDTMLLTMLGNMICEKFT